MGAWNLLSNHGQVLLCIAENPEARMREIAASVGITERTAHRIVAELVDGGYVAKERRGRRNVYRVRERVPLRDPLLRDRALTDLLAALGSERRSEPRD